MFFTVVDKEPAQVTTADVLAFIETQRAPLEGPNVVRLEDAERGLSTRTIKRRLASVSGLFAYLQARVAEGQTVVGRFTCAGTHTGTWLGHSATGRRFGGPRCTSSVSSRGARPSLGPGRHP